MRIVSIILLAFVLGHTAAAQQRMPRTLEEMRQHMLDMQRRMWEDLRNMPSYDFNFTFPPGDSSGVFRLDTTLANGSRIQFYQFSPFGGGGMKRDTTLRGPDFDAFFHDFFFGPGDPFARPRQDFPADDGNAPADDGLLPEERLRQQQDAPPAEKKKQPAPKPVEPEKPKVKSIRI